MIEFVSCTKRTHDDFLKHSALGLSLQRLAYDSRIRATVAFENRQGLPILYNQRVLASDSCEYLVFLHDDVWLDDYFVVDRVLAGLQHYDVIGLAGNKRITPNQPSWAFLDPVAHSGMVFDAKENLSGAVAHGPNPFGTVSSYGSAPADCQLLDGLFLAVRKSRLIACQVQFDPRFDFHFYDLDFSRTAVRQGLRIGTWPISVTHQSGGNMMTPHWQQQYRVYLEKWGS